MTLEIVRGRALLGPALTPVEDSLIEIEDGMVMRCGTRDPHREPSKIESIDASGLTLVPGFIDAHVHIGLSDPDTVLHGGVTTVRDLGWPEEQILRLAHEGDGRGRLRILAAGPILTVAGGYPLEAAWAPAGTGRLVGSAANARSVVRDLSDKGCTVIKVALNAQVGPTIAPEVLAELIDEAHSEGLKVAAHIYGLDELRKALSVGLDEMAHMLMGPEVIPDETIEEMVVRGMVVVPTLSCRFSDQAIAIDNLARFKAEGGRIVYGTDLGNEGPQPGIDPREITAMQAAGMDGRDIIQSATVTAAVHLGLPDIGAIAPGRHADLIGVEGDPLKDPMALIEPRFVMSGGRVVKGSGPRLSRA